MINFKNNKGITLTALIITVVVLTIIAGTAVYTGTDVLEDAKEELFIQELQIVQNAVNNEASKIELGQKSYADYIIDADKIDEDAFIEYTAEEVQTKFGITGIKQNVKINLITKEVKSVNGINIDGEIKHSLNELVELNQIKPTDDKVLKYYVQDGLILHLDSINNTGEGHSDTVTEWTDLVTGNETISDSKNYIIDLPELYQNGSGTVETGLVNNVLEENSSRLIGKFQGGDPKDPDPEKKSPGYGSIIALSQNGTTITIQTRYTANGKIDTLDPAKYLIWNSITTNNSNRTNISTVINYNEENNKTEYKNWVDGSLKTTRAEEGKIVYPYIEKWDDHIEFTITKLSEVHCVRAYNRALTNEEVLHNYYIDLYRF